MHETQATVPLPSKRHDAVLPLFSKAFPYCENHYDRTYILSAKHGLLSPEEIIEPYDVTLNDMKAAAKRQWAQMVYEQIRRDFSPEALQQVELFAFHAGANYRQYLIPLLTAHAPCIVPLSGLGIGQQLKYYTDRGY